MLRERVQMLDQQLGEGGLLNVPAKLIHALIEVGADFGAALQLLNGFGIEVPLLFIVELMLQAGPEIHGDGAELDLRLHHALFVGKEDWHADDQVQTAVAVELRMLDIVLFFDQSDIVLLEQGVGQHIHIILEGADDTDAGDIVNMLLHGSNRHGQALPLQLAKDADGLFEAGFDAVDGIAVKLQRKFLVEDVAFGLDLHHSAFVVGHQLGIAQQLFQLFRRRRGGGTDIVFHIAFTSRLLDDIILPVPYAHRVTPAERLCEISAFIIHQRHENVNGAGEKRPKTHTVQWLLWNASRAASWGDLSGRLLRPFTDAGGRLAKSLLGKCLKLKPICLKTSLL